MTRGDWLTLIGAVLTCLAVGALGGLATSSSVHDWYPTLVKPSFNPPAWVFGPVWTTLYIMMGISAFLVLRQRGQDPRWKPATLAFAVQLLLNALWSPAFFGLRWSEAGLGVIVLLWIAIVVTIALQRRVSTPAAVLMLPYLVWVSFATVLNASLVWLN
jgi:tryptophan-rich sensory protein